MQEKPGADPGSDSIFDYVIVGGGSAGCVLANRLSADSRNRVCLLEAGPEDSSPLIHVPLGVAALFAHRRLNWRFMTVRQDRANERRVYTPRGKVLGGSSSINGMAYMRGHPRDYDDWVSMGNPGWSFAEVLPYFLRSENNEVWRNSPFHGTTGPLNVAAPRSRNRTADAFVRAAQEHQIPWCEDFNGPLPEGVGFRQLTQRKGRRESSATAFLKPVLSRPNLRVMTGVLVDTILFDGRRATGVRLAGDASPRQMLGRREVILCAGAVASPQILLRSGIGDAQRLSALGISVVKDLPGVGQNLQDHAVASATFATNSVEPYGLSARALPRIAWSALEYLLFRRGMFSSSNLSEAIAFVRSSAACDRPDIQLAFMCARRGKRTDNGGMPKTPLEYGHGYGITGVVLHPRSRGMVTIDSTDPSASPLIDPGFFTDEEDLETLLRALKLGRQILHGPGFDRFDSRELAPGTNVQSDAALRAYIRKTSSTAFHPVGTCAMGRGPASVVDSRLSVHGVAGLRVVVASIMPSIVGGNTNAPTVMIAEKAADMLLGRPPLPPVNTQWFDPA